MLEKFERILDVAGRKRMHCSSCKRVTIHNIEAKCSGLWHDPDEHISGGEDYCIYRCGACDNVCYETVSWDSMDIEYDDDGHGRPAEISKQYPAPVSAKYNFNTEATPGHLDNILDEMLYAFAGSKMILATIGLRLAIEFIAKDKNCAGNNLAGKIDDLHKKGHIDDDQKLLLHRLREKGNAGAHEALGMNTNELIAGMSIVEGLLEKLYNGPARHAATVSRAKRILRTDTEGKED